MFESIPYERNIALVSKIEEEGSDCRQTSMFVDKSVGTGTAGKNLLDTSSRSINFNFDQLPPA
jgi:hypothetical protein